MLHCMVFEREPTPRAEIARLVRTHMPASRAMVHLYDSLGQYLALSPQSRPAADIALICLTVENAIQEMLSCAHLVKLLPYCQIIFVSDVLEHALEVYSVPHTYFVLRTQLSTRLGTALGTALKNLADAQSRVLRVMHNRRSLVLRQADIEYIERVNRSSKIHCIGQEYIVTDPLTDLASRLDADHFIQCHNSYVVNIRAVREYRRTSFLLEFGDVVPIARSRSKAVQAFFSRYVSETK